MQAARILLCGKLCSPELTVSCVPLCLMLLLFQAEARPFAHEVEKIKSRKEPAGENSQPKLNLRLHIFKE